MLKNLRNNKLYIFLGPLAMTAPLTSFLGFYGISLLSSETFFLFAILILIGLLAGLVMAVGGNLIQALISSGIIVLLVLSEVDRSFLYLPGIRFRYFLLLCIFLVSLLLYFLRENRIHFLFVIFGAMWLGGWAFSPNKDLAQISENSNHSSDASLPPYIHIVLDEHIGIEGIPTAFDKNNEFSLKLKEKYIDQGFLLFGRAYSRFSDSHSSFSSFLNFQSSINSHKNLIPIDKNDGFRPAPIVDSIGLRPNALFEALGKRGYIINTFSPKGFSFCDDSPTTTTTLFGKCVVYGDGLELYHDEFMILHNFLRKLGLLNMYAAMAPTFGMPEINLAAYPQVFQAVTSANEFIEFLGEGKPGNAYFFHLIIPHSAYVMDEKCSYKDDWNFFEKKTLGETYARYIEQISCAHAIVDKIIDKLDSNPVTKNSTIVIHGDHGSRIPSSSENPASFTSDEYIQYFSAFFAIRSPRLTPSYDRRAFALDELLKVSILEKPDFMSLDSKKEKFVYSRRSGTASDRSQAYSKFTLSPFTNGGKVQAW